MCTQRTVEGYVTPGMEKDLDLSFDPQHTSRSRGSTLPPMSCPPTKDYSTTGSLLSHSFFKEADLPVKR